MHDRGPGGLVTAGGTSVVVITTWPDTSAPPENLRNNIGRLEAGESFQEISFLSYLVSSSVVREECELLPPIVCLIQCLSRKFGGRVECVGREEPP